MREKILVVTDNLRDQINGVVTTFKNIETHARADGFDIVYLDPGQFSYISCPGYPQVKLSWPRSIGQKIQAINPDYIHIATEGPLGLASRFWLDKHQWKYNTSYHTKFPEFLKQLYGIPESLTYRYVRWFHKHSGQVLTTTQTMVNELKAHGFNGNIVAWSRGVDREVFNSSLREQLTTTEPVLLSVGRISREKNLDEFCSLDYLGTKIVVGDGPYRAELEQRYPSVHFVGAKTGAELAKYFACADVFVFTSLTDTFGIVIIESLSVGTPVAAFDVAGPNDIIENGVTGYLGTNLKDNIDLCLELNRTTVEQASSTWTWDNCWTIFKNNLIKVS